MKESLLLSGSGGQGIISGGFMLAESAVESDKHATFLPEYGPEQRGGSAQCTVTISDTEILSPLVKKCSSLIAMNEQAYKKFYTNLKAGGLMIINANRVTSEVTRKDVKVLSIPCDDIAVEIGNPKIAIIIMIGALLGASGILSKEAFLSSIEQKFAEKKPEVMEMNAIALQKGIDIGKQSL
ncbi:MAG: 2-oxoacid:acceptor oxidoreductase family protein [Oscillospiraceae bacterium]|jgi:2-oxoglutarate ferredoxin oxidoreductase subunit gamma|nr:2-oxoacid:acceptor oxidoreductase family protein [Oscillospiraceae bacterium]